MIIDLENYDLIKALTRTEAKKVHKDLPAGGSWRTIKGHHIYIVNGKIVAGSIPGVTKAKKMTKATMAEHQATLDAEGKKKNGKPSKPKSAGKAKKDAGKTVGSDSKGAGGAKKAKNSGSGKKGSAVDASKPKKTVQGVQRSDTSQPSPADAGSAPKSKKPSGKKAAPKAASKEAKKKVGANGTKSVEAKTDGNAKKPTAKSSGTGKPIPNGEKKPASEGGTKNKPTTDEKAGLGKAKTFAKEAPGFTSWLDAIMGVPEAKKAVIEEKKRTGMNENQLYKEWSKPELPAVDAKVDNPEDHYELFHGTKLPTLEKILSEGFKPNGGHSDFGNAAYFKSPAFDPLDQKDWHETLDKMKSKGHTVPDSSYDKPGNYSASIIKFFADSKEPAFVKAFIPKHHMLDCSQGRPKELQRLIDEADKAEYEGTREATYGFVLKAILGVKTKDMTSKEIYETYEKHLPELQKFWGKDAYGREFNPNKVSPYEIYAKKSGVKAIVDKLNVFKEEGWQIGVYDPSIIKIADHGKNIQYNKEKQTIDLIKALRKAMKNAPYCLLHHEITPEGLVMHIGVQGNSSKAQKKLEKAIMAMVLESGTGDVTATYEKELRKALISLDYIRKLGQEHILKEHFDNLWKTTLNNDIDHLKELGVNAEQLRPTDTGVQPKRSAYNVANPDEVIYIPVNRLQTPYQTEKATNFDKVQENFEKMKRGENLEPVSIGLNYDVHDGHHRIEASKKMGHEHIPCIVKGGNDIDRQRALEAYKEVWKSIQPDPTRPWEHEPNIMFRGVGARELRNINKTGFIQSKGKGNDADKGVSTCFSNLWSQAEGYARSNYDLYNEKNAFVLVVRKPEDIEEDEHGELVAHRPIPVEDVIDCVYIPKPDIMKSFNDLIKSFDEGKHPRDERGQFALAPGVRAQLAKVVKAAKPVNNKRKTVHTGSVFGLEAKLEEVINHIAKPITDQSKDFNRQEALRVIADLKKMGFRRDADNDRDNDKQTHAAYSAEFRVNPSKALIVRVYVGKWKHNGKNASGVLTCRYLGEAQAHQKERRKKIFAEHNVKKNQ